MAHTEPSLPRLPELDKGDVNNDAGGHDAPLPGDGIVLEDEGVDLGEVDNGKCDEEAGGNGAEEEPIVPDGMEDRKGALAPQFRIHSE